MYKIYCGLWAVYVDVSMTAFSIASLSMLTSCNYLYVYNIKEM